MAMNDGEVSFNPNYISLSNKKDLMNPEIKVPLKEEDRKGLKSGITKVQQGVIHKKTETFNMSLDTGIAQYPKLHIFVLGLIADGIPPTIGVTLILEPSKLLSNQDSLQYTLAMSVDGADSVMTVLGGDKFTLKQ